MDDMSPAHHQQEPETVAMRRSIDWRSVAIWFAGLVAPAALSVAAWAHGTLWAHDTRITTLEVQRQATAGDYTEHKDRDQRVQSEIRETLRRLEDKIDRIAERRP
jgi:hypothetical protein